MPVLPLSRSAVRQAEAQGEVKVQAEVKVRGEVKVQGEAKAQGEGVLRAEGSEGRLAPGRDISMFRPSTSFALTE